MESETSNRTPTSAGLGKVMGKGASKEDGETAKRTRDWVCLKEKMRVGRHGAGAAIAKGKLFVVGAVRGGDAAPEAFDLKEGKWEKLPSNKCGSRRWCTLSVSSDQTKVYVVGGSKSSVEVYDIEAKKWSSLPDMLQPRDGAGVALTRKYMYVVGGCDMGGRPLSSAEVYNFSEKKWTMMPDMIKPREGVAAVVSNDGKRLYAVGGKSGGSGGDYHTHSTAEVFEDGSWKMIKAAMNVGREGLGAVITPQGVIYAIGGWDNADNKILNSVERLDTNNIGTKPSRSGWERWELCSYRMTRRRDYTSAAMTPDGSLVFVVGGRSSYDPQIYEDTVDVLRLDDMESRIRPVLKRDLHQVSMLASEIMKAIGIVPGSHLI
eukprot:CAMPEP_0185253930 /NCGR_PEP_ID=MMETSP1359-20130426/2528_1 /TAXON_ID=552665 /ORGANISM="Bigelowiella longifila, Strain CCMP242" /LENGTH=375 /DNA_ID=CAMNT_0027836427 /DNA_START=45 /DNA_END=1172 /DNA_ORIENTATION=-